MSSWLGVEGSRDEYYTPQYAVLPIIKYLPKEAVIWCPFDTPNSEFVLTLQEHGFKVEHSHIITGQDFYKYEPERWDIIISNPPFTGKTDIFKRCLSFNKPFALLMACTWFNDSAPYRLFHDKDMELLLFNRRIQYHANVRIPFGSCYICHRLLPKQIVFENLEVTKTYSRMYEEMKKLDVVSQNELCL